LNIFGYQQFEEEVRRYFDYYFIAHNLGKDIEEVMSWDYVKFQKWKIYFKILMEQSNQGDVQLNGEKEHLYVFR